MLHLSKNFLKFEASFLPQENILLMKYVQPNVADFEIPKLKIRIVHRYVQLLLKMTPKLNDTHFEMVYNLFHSTMEVIIKRIVFVAQSN